MRLWNRGRYGIEGYNPDEIVMSRAGSSPEDVRLQHEVAAKKLRADSIKRSRSLHGAACACEGCARNEP